uniref:Putative lipocalin-3 1 n=1 Tax=Amblyomma americanum TaxID=6943 RepID=A0A0C9S585_AMBAM
MGAQFLSIKAMAALLSFLGLVFSLFVAMALTGSAPEASDIDFKHFLGDGKTIWVYNTSENGTVTCRRDKIFKVEQQSVCFTRLFKNKSRDVEENLNGTLFNWAHWDEPTREPYDSMLVSTPAGVEQTDEILEFLDIERICAVVKVIKAVLVAHGFPPVWRELRINASNLFVGPSKNCMEYFNTAVQESNQTSRPSYFPDCGRSP